MSRRPPSARALCAAGLLLALPTAASAETLVFAPSSDRVEITSNFAGTTLTVFGSVERDAASVGRPQGRDLAVVLEGPAASLVTRRRERLFGVWVNRAARTYEAPRFYAVATSRPIADMATPAVLRATRLGIDQLILPERVPGGVEVLAGTADFRDAFLRLQRRAGHYVEYPGGVKRLGAELWAATLPIPADVPVGAYRVRVVLIGDGSPLAEESADVQVVKSGFEQQVADLAADRPILYGLVSVALALLTGWLGGVLFRRD